LGFGADVRWSNDNIIAHYIGEPLSDLRIHGFAQRQKLGDGGHETRRLQQ
jgi:hypothetical protein